MNIREHIEAGHYPVDDKGRALVPHSSGCTAVIVSTNGPGTTPLVGWMVNGDVTTSSILTWDANAVVLRKPPPRKVKVTRIAHIDRRGLFCTTYANRDTAEARLLADGGVLFEMSGEYEEPLP